MASWPPDWPNQYLDPKDATKSPHDPTWPKDECFDAGQALAAMLLSRADDAEQFRAIVEDAKRNGGEHIRDYERIIGSAYDLAGLPDFNSNDFANVFRVAWLLIGRALTTLTNQNPHGDWGDPPPNGSLHFEESGRRDLLYYHFVPNATGYFAVSTGDLTMPNAGV